MILYEHLLDYVFQKMTLNYYVLYSFVYVYILAIHIQLVLILYYNPNDLE
nr:MAG TPA: hypothetical protein [Crassvirales sp.]